MMRTRGSFAKTLLVAATLGVGSVFTQTVFAQGPAVEETAQVPFLVNVNATVSATSNGGGFEPKSISVEGGKVATLSLPLQKANGVRFFGTQRQANAPAIVSGNGKVAVSLPAQSYKSAEISLYTVNGKRILRGHAGAAGAARKITSRDLAPGMYLLSIKGDGGAISSRLTHGGGGLDISVAFGAESRSQQALSKKAAEGNDWIIVVKAAGYVDKIYGISVVGGQNPQQEVVLVTEDATPAPNIYTIIYNPNAGGVTVTPGFGKTNGNGRLLSLPPTPTRSGYTFNGWFTAETAGEKVTVETVFTKDAVIFAQWTRISYTITFDPNGGVVTPTSATTDADGKIASLPTPTRSGYTFNGWFTAATGGMLIRAAEALTAITDMIIYAQWTPVGPVVESVTIGTQKWMKKNVNIETADSWCYDNAPANCEKYGRLYTWNAAKTACPTGWHLPSISEWQTLVDFAGGDAAAGGKLKAASGWNETGNGTDEYGFTALPGGRRAIKGVFSYAGDGFFSYGDWWTATEVSGDSQAYSRGMRGDGNNGSGQNENDKGLGISARCIADGATVPTPDGYTITFNANGGTVTPSSAATDANGKLASMPTPTRSGYTFDGWFTAATGGMAVTANSTTFTKNITVYARWSAVAVESVTIGTQKWMKKNLNVETADSWCYDNDPENCAKYGRLYTWVAAKTACPAGWHLPSISEWQTLVDFAGGDAAAGGKLKAVSGWNETGNGTDEYGFTAMPGGQRAINGTFSAAGDGFFSYGNWWTATEVSGGSQAYSRGMRGSGNNGSGQNENDKGLGISARCISD